MLSAKDPSVILYFYQMEEGIVIMAALLFLLLTDPLPLSASLYSLS